MKKFLLLFTVVLVQVIILPKTTLSQTVENEMNTFDNNDGKPCPGAATLTDIDGNVYNTVQIGQQCWMRENLRTTRYANGSSIALDSKLSNKTAYRYYPYNKLSNVTTYGYLYNWKAVMGNSSSSKTSPSGVQGICPTGWHVPSIEEWEQLEKYVKQQDKYSCNGYKYGIALASTTGWMNCPENKVCHNITGFTALPAGGYYGINGRGDHLYSKYGSIATFWTATEEDSHTQFARRYEITCSGSFYENTDYLSSKLYFMSLRCVRNETN